MRPFIVRAFIGGFFGTIALMVLLYYAAPAIGVNMDWAGDIARTLQLSLWKPGMVAFFFLGTIILPIIYSYIFFRILPGATWLKGLEFGLVLWIVTEVLLRQQIPDQATAGALAFVVTLIAQLVYGVVLGTIGGPATVVGVLRYVSKYPDSTEADVNRQSTETPSGRAA